VGGDGRSTKWSTGSPARTAGPRDPGRHPHRPRPRWGPARSGCRVIPPAPSSASRIGAGGAPRPRSRPLVGRTPLFRHGWWERGSMQWSRPAPSPSRGPARCRTSVRS
jgi:hypothetical protein